MVTIRFADSEAEREAIYHLRYRIYVEELGAVSFPGVDHERRWLGEGGMCNSRLLYAEVDGNVVATLRLQLGADNALSEDDAVSYEFARFAGYIDPGQIGVISRFMALPEHRGGPLSQRMLIAMYEFCVAQEVVICFLDCRPHLLNLYQRLGFRCYGRPYSEPGYGLLIPMALLLDDRDHLAAVGSPLLERASQTPTPRQTTALAALLHDEQPAVHPSERLLLDATQCSPSGLADESRAWLGLLSDFTRAELARLLARGHVLACRYGDKLIVDGDVEHSIFLVLNGQVEARVGERVVAVEGPGSVIGEVAYLLGGPRTADVVAAEDGVRVLYLRYQLIEALIQDEPRLAARLLLNLSRSVANKLRAKYR